MIEVELLSKKYIISHEVQGAYSTIVDTVSRTAKKLYKKVTHPFRRHKEPPQKTYEEFWALKELSFSCKEGDRLGIIGKNGAGKSTLLKILSRIIEPTSGTVKIQGRVASLLEVGTGFHPELTGRENIFLNGAILGMGKKEIIKNFDEIVAFSEVEKFLDTPVKYYSSGMYGRLGFAIAAHLDPDILIVDEVLAVGDAAFQEKCIKKMDSVSKTGRTIIFVSHNPAAMMALCNTGIYLEKGMLKASGSMEHCLQMYMQTVKQKELKWKGLSFHETLEITSAGFKGDKEFFYQDEIATLEIECSIKSKLIGSLGFTLKNNREQVLGHSFLNLDPNIAPKLLKPGSYTFTMEIPLKHLFEGEYGVYITYHSPIAGNLLSEEIALKLPIFKPLGDEIFINSSHQEGLLLPFAWQEGKYSHV